MKLRILRKPIVIVFLLLLSSMFLVGDTIYLPLVVGGAVAAEADEVLIPAGEFQRGCVAELNAGFTCPANEMPVRPVYLDDYYIDKFEVTINEYKECVADLGCTLPSNTVAYNDSSKGGTPVMYVDWYQAELYCLWENKRLPTEAEWEKAARGDGYPRTYPWGEAKPACEWMHMLFGSCYPGTLPVDWYASNDYSIVESPYGLYGMAGNVFEWVNDYYQADYYSDAGSLVNPQGPGSGNFRVLRGGAWDWDASQLRVTFRSVGNPENSFNAVGFRCARSQ